MGSAGDPPAPSGDPPTGTSESNFGERCPHWLEPLLPFRPARQRTGQASRLCYPKPFFTVALKAAPPRTDNSGMHRREGSAAKEMAEGAVRECVHDFKSCTGQPSSR